MPAANPAVENVLATVGTVLWTGQLIPQVWKSYREKSTDGLSPWLMFLWASATMFLGVYIIVQNINIPLIVQPQLFGALASLSWVQCLYYEKKFSRRACILIYVSFLGLLGGFQAGLTYAVRAGVNRGNTRPLDFFGIFGTLMILAGPLPQFYEIYVRREVVGISLIFMAIDMTGGIFNALSLVWRKEFDSIASLSYIGVTVLDALILLCAAILNPLAKRRRARERERERQRGEGEQGASATSTVVCAELARTPDLRIDSESAVGSTVEKSELSPTRSLGSQLPRCPSVGTAIGTLTPVDWDAKPLELDAKKFKYGS